MLERIIEVSFKSFERWLTCFLRKRGSSRTHLQQEPIMLRYNIIIIYILYAVQAKLFPGADDVHTWASCPSTIRIREMNPIRSWRRWLSWCAAMWCLRHQEAGIIDLRLLSRCVITGKDYVYSHSKDEANSKQ